MNISDFYLIICMLAIAIVFGMIFYHTGVARGATRERIRLTGNSLPRFENPPPPPMKDPYAIEIVRRPRCPEPLCTQDAIWKVQPDRGSEESAICCTDHMQLWVDRLQGKPYRITRIRDGYEVPPPKEKGVPNMPNHPPMPQHVLDARAYAADFLNQHPQATREQAYESGYLLAIRIAQAAGRINKAKDQFEEAVKHRNVGNYGPEVTQDQLIDALMDMRLENFLCAHTIPAHAGTDLYYFSRKETAEYLLDMYTITPKAKH